MTVWEVLGIEPTGDIDTIRRAYARRLKVTNPEDDPDGFQTLRQAYEAALSGDLSSAEGPTSWPAAPVPNLGPDLPPEPAAAPTVTLPYFDQLQRQLRSPAPSDRKAHLRLREDLGRLVGRPLADPDAVFAAWEALLASPAMAAVDTETATEAWLAQLISRHAPRSDILVAPAVARFRWGEDGLGERDDDVRRILQRAADIEARPRIRNTHREAWKLLSRPFRTTNFFARLIMPATTWQIGDLLAELPDHPTLVEDLNPETVAQWENWHDVNLRMSVGGGALATVAILALLCPAIAFNFLPNAFRPLSILPLLSPFAVLGGVMIKIALDTPRHDFDSARNHAPAWQAFGWLALPPIVFALALMPELPAYPWPIVVLALGTAVWAIITTEADASHWVWWLRSLFGELELVVLTATLMFFVLHVYQAPAFLAPALATLAVTMTGGPGLRRFVAGLPQWLRGLLILPALAASAGAILLYVRADGSDHLALLSAALAVVAAQALWRPLQPSSLPTDGRLRLAIAAAVTLWAAPELPSELVLPGAALWLGWNLFEAIRALYVSRNAI